MLSFTLPETFIESYVSRPVPWGYADAAGNSLGEFTFLRTYSRLKDDGTKERWHEVCRRVIEGMYSIQKDHAKANCLPWNERKAQRSAQEAYERLFVLKWTPPGRGLWVMGTPLVHEHGIAAALQNCAFISTADMTPDEPAWPFAFLMEASMLGVGVGFDTKGGTMGFPIYKPAPLDATSSSFLGYTIPDTREGWVRSVVLLLESYLKPGLLPVKFNYDLIRKAGEPIKTFGGTAAGPEPLKRLHDMIRLMFFGRAGSTLTTVDVADIGNMIGVCVVAGNVRRSAELLIGSLDDPQFLLLKNSEAFPERNSYDPATPGWGWMSNNSVEVTVGTDLSGIIDGIARNGEPGVIWMDVARAYGRLKDAPDYRDYRLAGFNPCAEQGLESGEMCTLVETYINRHESMDDFLRTQKFAYLYAKTVTLLQTHWPETNAIMQRNRRIGTSVSGQANFADRKGLRELATWLDLGYSVVRHYDKLYSEWLCVRESIKTTTVKPSGTVSILAGESPGVHWTPGGEFFDRAVRVGKDDPLVALYRAAGYRIEPASESPDTTVVIFFPIKSEAKRSEKDVSIYEKANLAVLAQREWSDNAVSVTLSFDKETEADDVARVLAMYEGQLKTVSFLPMGNDIYPQMPYTQITADDWASESMSLWPVDLSPIYDGTVGSLDAVGEAYCTTDACEVKTVVENAK